MKNNKKLKGVIIIGGIILIFSLIFSDKYDYDILKVEETDRQKIQLDIGIKNKISKEELNGIVNEIQNDKNGYDRMFIWFHLQNDINKKPWAVANYSDKKWEITAVATLEVEKKLKETNIKYEIIGKWYEESAINASTNIFYRKDNKIFKLSIYHDYTNSTSEIETKDNITYTYKENFHGEYFKIESNGNLGFYNVEKQKFLEAERY